MLEGMATKRDAAMERLEAENTESESEKAITVSSAEVEERLSSSSPSIEMSRREAPPSAAGNSVLNVRNFRRRPREGSILGRGRARGRSSSVESDIGAGVSMVNAPRIENSTLAKGNFRRRAREPSILGGAVDRQRSSSPALDLDVDSTGLASAVATPAQPAPGSALKFGTFRRRVRQPSILSSAQKPRGNAFGLPDDDDFAPEDESTPLNLSKNRADIGTSSQPPASSSASRKRKISDIEVPRSSPAQSSDTDIYGLETIPATASQRTRQESTPQREEASELVGEEEGEEEVQVEPETLATPEPQSDTMAPPLSSSPMPSIETPPRDQPIRSLVPQPTIGTRRQPPRNQPQQITATQDSPISSPPPLTHSPNYKKPAATRKLKEQKRPDTFSTAQLQDLLPRRRRRQHRNEFDVPSSSDELDTSGLRDSDDELSHLNVGTGRRTPGVPSLASLKKRPGAKPASEKTTPAKPSAKRTYASRRAVSSDKENAAEGSDEEMEDSLAPIQDTGVESEASQELEKRLGRELKLMKRKFEDVDKWELDFEEVTASSSSPRDAR